MSIETILNDIDQIIEEAKSVPFSSKRMVDAEEISQMIEEIRLNMPVEITQAKKIDAGGEKEGKKIDMIP